MTFFSRSQGLLYERSARRIRESEADAKAEAINDGVLIDSFLRGWDLAFVDNSAESPYRNWLATNRTAVWGEIFKQAASQSLALPVAGNLRTKQPDS